MAVTRSPNGGWQTSDGSVWPEDERDEAYAHEASLKQNPFTTGGAPGMTTVGGAAGGGVRGAGPARPDGTSDYTGGGSPLQTAPGGYTKGPAGWTDATGARVGDPTLLAQLEGRGAAPVEPPPPPGGRPPTQAEIDANAAREAANAIDDVAPTRPPEAKVKGLDEYLTQYGLTMPDYKADYDKYLRPAETVFRDQLARLQGPDPFGNQAFLQKATDRGVAQARAVAAGARGGAGAVGGAFRQAQGVQSQLASEGAQQMTQLKAQDQRTAQGLQLQAADGLAGLAKTGAEATLKEAEGRVAAFDAGFKAIMSVEGLSLEETKVLGDLNATADRLSFDQKKAISDAAIELAKLSQDASDAEADRILKKYSIDKEYALGIKKLAAETSLSFKDVFLGVLSGASKVGAAKAMPG